MKKEPQIFDKLQAQDEPVPTGTLDMLEMGSLKEFVQEALGSYYGRTREKKQVVSVPRLKIVVDVPGVDVQDQRNILKSAKAVTRKSGGGGFRITGQSILDVVNAGLGLAIDDFANGELANGEKFLFVGKTGSGPPLNVIAVLNMRPGNDELRVVTVMRKQNFGSDLRRYEVNV